MTRGRRMYVGLRVNLGDRHWHREMNYELRIHIQTQGRKLWSRMNALRVIP